MTSKISGKEIGKDVYLRSNGPLGLKNKFNFIDITQIFLSNIKKPLVFQKKPSLEGFRKNSTPTVLRFPFNEHILFPDLKAYFIVVFSIPKCDFESTCIPEITPLKEEEEDERKKHPGIIDLEKEYNNGFEPRVLLRKKRRRVDV